MDADCLPAYRVGGVTLRSELALPELGPPQAVASADWTFSLSARRPRPPEGAWFHYWKAGDGRRWLSFGRDRDEYLLRFTRMTTFRLSPARRTIVCEGARRVPRRAIRHLLLHQVLPLALSRTDRFVLHASGVLDGSGVIGFAGHTGAGKSTLCAALARTGSPIVCDDVLVIEKEGTRAIAVPMDTSVRLWPDSLGALLGSESSSQTPRPMKKRVTVGDAASARPQTPMPLRVLCILGLKDTMRQARRVEVRPLSPRDAVISLTGFGFQLDIRNPADLRADFERLSAVAETVPVVELVYPWRLASVHEIAKDVLDALRCWS